LISYPRGKQSIYCKESTDLSFAKSDVLLDDGPVFVVPTINSIS